MSSNWPVSFFILSLVVFVESSPLSPPRPCHIHCPKIFNPVCASDGKTYNNKCLLDGERICKNKPNLYVVHYGACLPPTPCRVPCPRILNPVCGSDGKTYDNRCMFDTAKRCENKPNLSIDHLGPCVPPPPCRRRCPALLSQVCGSDGKTYDNECELDNVKRCENKPYLSVNYRGPCAPPPCQMPCPRILNPVCGSDGKTYNNRCMFDNAKRCENKPNLYIAHYGACVPPTPCKRGCPRLLSPVCGSDGKTYVNECELGNAKRCENKPNLSVNYRGPCVPPPCRKSCLRILSPVCGSDGKTYDNKCELDNEKKCENKPYLFVAHYGACAPKPCNVQCTSIYNPVCGTDGKTYSSTCLLRRARICENKSNLAIDHFGACQ